MTLLTAEAARKMFSYDPQTGRVTRRVARGRGRVGAEAGWVWKTRQQPGRRMISVGSKNRKVYYTARVIWLLVTGEWPRYEVDHIDGDPLNDRWANLRDVPTAVNAKNKGILSNNSSGAMGVRWKEDRHKWQARVKVGGREKHLGYFFTLEEATQARKRADRRYGFHKNHGRPAWTEAERSET